MGDYGHELQFGSFITPAAQPASRAVELAIASEQAGLDLVTFQDHPYQGKFYDTWTLLAYVASRTSRIRVAGNVLNLPLRQPAVLARAAASLDLLSGGRFEMGLGAGAFWDGIAAMGGDRLTAGESIAALEEAMAIMRQIWDVGQPGGVRVDGGRYHVVGAKRGPAPAHPIGIWLGAYKPRILRLTGRAADGWLPSLAYLPGGLPDLEAMNGHIDAGAAAAGRDPRGIRRMLNIAGQFSREPRGLLAGPPDMWASQLADAALTYGISTFILAVGDEATIELFASEVAPATRALVRAARAS
ncbi:LLM class flavin-dependent oxidoreductase [Chloroflexia bacterium SDU3-3]|nr:LLM class flavin-dependent oxidoreductase [Chloroflexia bacterium SDU3-3]